MDMCELAPKFHHLGSVRIIIHSLHHIGGMFPSDHFQCLMKIWTALKKTLRAYAVQSETCHPWSATWKPHPPLDMWQHFLLKSPEGLSMIWEAFMKTCAFLRVLLYSSAILHANIAWTAKATSHSWPDRPALSCHFHQFIGNQQL